MVTEMPKRINILYGSQTGNAEDLAKRIGLKAKQLGYPVLVEALDDFPIKTLPQQDIIVFVCSTTGYGQEPENMRNFFNFIRRRDLPSTCLSKVRFTVYGLGDSSYLKFNYISKILFKRLKNCGAEPIQDLVLGDEQHNLGCDGIIYPKLDELWVKLEEIYKLPSAQDEAIDPQSCYNVNLCNHPSDIPTPTDRFKEEYIKEYGIHKAYCTTNQRVTDKTHFQDTRFICFKADNQLGYLPGDVCAILPENSEESTDLFIKILNLESNQRISLTKNDSNYMVNYLYDFIPDGLTVRELVKCYLDIHSVPKRSFFEYLWHFCTEELQRDKLKEFATTEGQREMYEYCILPKRSILEVLGDFQFSIKDIKFDYILDMIPPIKPRSFSIASAPEVHPNEIQLLVGVVKYNTRLKKIREGLCSNYLANLTTIEAGDVEHSESSKLRFSIKRTSFKLPPTDKTNILLIGAGLGIAPHRSFIQSRDSRILENCYSFPTYLYFGCRDRKKDFYFEEELNEYSKRGTLRYRAAFSREKWIQQWVQNILLEDIKILSTFFGREKPLIYIAGNSKLPETLRYVLGRILYGETELKPNQLADREELIAKLEAEQRIQYDCW